MTCAHKTVRCRPKCYGYNDPWKAQARCVDCGKMGKLVTGCQSKDEARTKAIDKLLGVS